MADDYCSVLHEKCKISSFISSERKVKGKHLIALFVIKKRLNVHIEILLRCHHPETLCKKDALMNFQKLTGIAYATVSFS